MTQQADSSETQTPKRRGRPRKLRSAPQAPASDNTSLNAAFDSDSTSQPSPERSKYSPKQIPISLILEYAQKRLSTSEIGALVGCDHSNIVRRLQPYRGHIAGLESFKTNRADLLAVEQSRALAHLTDEKLQKAGARDLAIISGVLYDKERLERGQSTENINLMAIHGDLAQIQSDRERLAQELKSLKGTVEGEDAEAPPVD